MLPLFCLSNNNPRFASRPQMAPDGNFRGSAFSLKQPTEILMGRLPSCWQVWDGRNAIVVDVRENHTRVLAIPMHHFNKAGKTKRWEFEWEKSEYIYPDKVLLPPPALCLPFRC